MSDIITTLKQKGTDNDVYPNVIKDNIPYDDTITNTSSKFPTSAAVYKDVLNTYSVNLELDDYPDNSEQALSWTVPSSDIESIPNFIIEINIAIDTTDHFLRLSIHNCCYVHYSDHEEYIFTVYDSERIWKVTVTYPSATATIISYRI